MFLSKSEVIKWFAEYDRTTNIEYKNVDLSAIKWQRCYASPMVRALKTATHIYDGQILEIPALKELDILHRLSDGLKMPFFVWGLVVRIKSLLPHQENADFKREIVSFIDRVIADNEGDILIVSHWFVMRIMRKALMQRGLHGENFKSHDYGQLYIYHPKKAKIS